MAQLYAHIDHDGNVVNHVCYDEPPDMSILPPYIAMVVPNNVRAELGWKYSDGVFTDPSPQLIHVDANVNFPLLPISVPKEYPDITSIKTDIKSITESLSQVIKALNGLIQEKIDTPHILSGS